MESFIQNLADAINATDATISPADKLTDLPNWDSLAILTTIAMLDMEYGVTISGTELQNCATVADVHTLVETRKS